jgi:hypothetical protein
VPGPTHQRRYTVRVFAVDWATEIAGVALVVAVWLVLTRVFKNTSAGRHASHFLDVGGAELPPEERAKNTSHPGAGGGG